MKPLQINIVFLFTVCLLAMPVQAQDPANQDQDSSEDPFSLDRELLSAVSLGRHITVRDLLNFGADVYTTTEDENTALHLAAQIGDAIITACF